MGSVTRSIKRLFASGDTVATRLLRIFTPCLRGDGSKNINIRIFDPHELVNEMATSQEVVSELENFLHSMATQTGLDARIVAQLSPITFHVSYTKSTPSQAEINQLGVGDFPVYLLTATGLVRSSADEVVSLLVSHRIPELTFVGRRQYPDALVLSHVRAYQTLEDDWAQKPDVLGFGIPGTYFLPNSQTRCRKVGIIKMQGSMIENLAFPQRKKKILSVLEHELGHMFGLVHESNSLMDGDYKINANFTSYSNGQLWVVGRALEQLLQP